MKIFHVIGNETFYEIGNFGDWFIQFSQIKQNYLYKNKYRVTKDPQKLKAKQQ